MRILTTRDIGEVPEDPSLNENTTRWESMIASGVLDDFWDSPEVRILIETTERLLRFGHGLTLEQINRLQARLELIEDLKKLPQIAAKRSALHRERAREEANEKSRSAASRLVAGLPRIT